MSSLMRASAERLPPVQVVATYVGVITAAEVVVVFGNVLLGVVLHATLLAALLIHQGLLREGPQSPTLAPLTLVPLLRILSLTMPVPDLPRTMWLVLVGLPLAAAAYGVARQLRLSTSVSRWGSPRFWLMQAAIAGSGLAVAGAILVLDGGWTVPELLTPEVVTEAIVILVFVGFVEEAVFRGVIQPALSRVLSATSAVILTSVLFAAVHIGSLSLAETLLAAALGLCLGGWAMWTRSIMGAAVAHGLVAIAITLAATGDPTAGTDTRHVPVSYRGAIYHASRTWPAGTPNAKSSSPTINGIDAAPMYSSSRGELTGVNVGDGCSGSLTTNANRGAAASSASRTA